MPFNIPDDGSIPNFTHDNVLPPHLGSPTTGTMAPFKTSMEQLIRRFGHSKKRSEILKGLLRFRKVLFQCGVSNGFQWINGSFTQKLNRDPNDIDVVTFLHHPPTSSKHFIEQLIANHINPRNPKVAKEAYLCDAYFVNLSFDDGSVDPIYLVGRATYWHSLFTHTREAVHKGMLQIELSQNSDEHDRLMPMVEEMEASNE